MFISRGAQYFNCIGFLVDRSSYVFILVGFNCIIHNVCISIVLLLLQGLSKLLLCVLLHHARDIRNVLQQAYRNKKNETHQHDIHVPVTFGLWRSYFAVT